MDARIDLRIAELLAARLCHDLISPIAAINNGIELLSDDEPEFAAEAVALVGDSARKATRRLQFLRFAYGFGGGGLAGPAPHALAAEFFEESRIACDYGEDVRALPLDWQKLACNMAATGGEGLPRGGRLRVSGAAGNLAVEGSGEGDGLSAEARAALTLATPSAELTSRTVGAYFTGLIGKRLGCRLTVTAGNERFTLRAVAEG